MYQRTYAAILTQQLHLHILHIRLGIVYRIRVQRSQHSVNGLLHRRARVNIVDIIDIERLVQLAENLKVLGQLERTVGRYAILRLQRRKTGHTQSEPKHYISEISLHYTVKFSIKSIFKFYKRHAAHFIADEN